MAENKLKFKRDKETALKLIVPFLHSKSKAEAEVKLNEISKLIFSRNYSKETLDLTLMFLKRWKADLDKFMESIDHQEKTSRDTFIAYKALREIIEFSDLLEE